MPPVAGLIDLPAVIRLVIIIVSHSKEAYLVRVSSLTARSVILVCGDRRFALHAVKI